MMRASIIRYRSVGCVTRVADTYLVSVLERFLLVLCGEESVFGDDLFRCHVQDTGFG